MLRLKTSEYTMEATEHARQKFEKQTPEHKNKIITNTVLRLEGKVLEGYEGTPEYGEALLWLAEDVRNALEETGRVFGKSNITLEI
jgi:hypothetical protein